MTIIRWVFDFGLLELLSILFVLANFLTFFLYIADKRKAEKNKWRISERTLIFFTLAFDGVGALAGMRFARHKTQKTKFRIAATVGLVIVLIFAVHIAYGFTLGRVVRYFEVSFYSESWPPELNGYRIAFIADKHLITEEEMREVVAELNERDLDLLILGGDFHMGNAHYQGTIRQLAQTITTDGIFGVEGNHDDYVRLFVAKRQYGIIPLDNDGLKIREGFFLAGVHDMWNRTPSIEEATVKAGVSDFILLVTHNPDVTMEQRTENIDLILAAHTHGGQITFFGLPLYLLLGNITQHGMRFSHGYAYSADGVPVFTTNGVSSGGVVYDVPRVFARPEVVIFTMYSMAN